MLVACSPKPDLSFEGAKYRPPLGGAQIGVGYITILSSSPDTIQTVTSPKAERVEMHQTLIVDNQARMKAVESIQLPENEPVTFEPGGLHLMIHQPESIVAGDTFPITFGLQSGRTLTAEFELKAPGS